MRRSSSPARPRAGVSLTELLVGVAVITLALVPILSHLFSGMKSTSAGNMEVNAALIGSSIFEKLLNSTSFDDVAEDLKLDLLSGVSDEDGSSENNEVKYFGTTYKLKLAVKTFDNAALNVKFRQGRAGLFGKSDKEYAIPPADAKSHMKGSLPWAKFKVLTLPLVKFKGNAAHLKELFLEIHWIDPKGLERVYNFYTRKARIE